MCWFVAALLAMQVCAIFMLEVARPGLRDPEYGLRAERLHQRLAENPGRPAAVVLGSSRVTFGVRPQAWEDECTTRTRPLLFNMGRVGGGPLFELLTLRRLYADGVKPDVVLIEYWPPFLCEEGPFDEMTRVDASRLYLADRPLLRKYHPDTAALEEAMWTSRCNPLFAYRQRWLAALAPSWVPRAKRNEPGCRGMDAWGWVPGLENEPTQRTARLAHFYPIYRDHFAQFDISPKADRALRESITLARSQGAKVMLVHMPESSEFRQWYSERVEASVREHRERLCDELSVPFVDARSWLGDECFADGFHLTPAGAAAFTQRLGEKCERCP